MKKHYFFCLLLSSSFLIAMDQEFAREFLSEQANDKIHDIIAEKHLGISKSSCICMCVSDNIKAMTAYYKSWNMPAQAALDELKKIEGYYKKYRQNLHKNIFELLYKHWYVNNLINAVVYHNSEMLKSVTGSTIDQCYFFELNANRDTELHKNLSEFEKEIEKRVVESVFWTESFSHLYEDQRTICLSREGYIFNPFSLIMSQDGRFLQSKDMQGNIKVWDMQEGYATANDSTQIQWDESSEADNEYYPIAKNKFYSAKTTNYQHSTIGSTLSRYISMKKPEIILYQKQTPLFYGCCRAFENSKKDKLELEALKQSENFKAIKGFSKRNLEMLINQQLQILDKK